MLMGMQLVEFIEIDDVTRKEFHEAVAIYDDSLPAAERQENSVIRERVATKKERMFIGRLNGEVVFMALIWPLQHTDFVLFDYMAVKETYRNQGIGTKFVQNIFRISGIRDKRFILEVEDPRYGDNKEMRTRRVEFYRRNGAKIMKDVSYILPPLYGNTPTQMIVMVLSPYPDIRFSGKLISKIFVQIYRELYGRDENDKLLHSSIRSIPSTVELV